jgi:uncharacterized protein
MINPAEISKIAHRLGFGDKTIEKDYVLTWMLNAIAASPLHELLAFKGGTAIKKMIIYKTYLVSPPLKRAGQLIPALAIIYQGQTYAPIS